MLPHIWSQFLAQVEKDFNKRQPALFLFLKQLEFVSLQENRLTLNCHNPGLRSYVEQRLDLVEKELELFTHNKTIISLVVSLPKKRLKETPLLSFQPSTDDILIRSGFSRLYHFSNFAVSSSNQVAYAATMAMVDNPGIAYNPLFIYGGVGVGKTHLVQAAGKKILENDDRKKIYFSPGDLFTNELIEAIRAKSTPRFRRKYRYLDLLIIDDVQFIAGKRSVQEEFFHTFNSIISSGGQIVLTSDRSPKEIKDLEDRLRSRFSGGLTIDIQLPDFELRTAILLIKAQEKNIEIDMEAAKLIAENIEDSRSLEGTLLSVYAKILGKKEQIEAQDVLDFFSNKTEEKIKKISPYGVIKTVCSYYNLKVSRIKGESKENQIALPRQLAMYLLRSYLKLKLTQVAFLLNRKDHTTVIHAVDKISRLLAKDPLLKREADNIVSSLGLST